jgi:hypothetical protein
MSDLTLDRLRKVRSKRMGGLSLFLDEVTVDDVVAVLVNEGAEAVELAEVYGPGQGVVDKEQRLVTACHDEGPYWNLEPGRYLVWRVDSGPPPEGTNS